MGVGQVVIELAYPGDPTAGKGGRGGEATLWGIRLGKLRGQLARPVGSDQGRRGGRGGAGGSAVGRAGLDLTTDQIYDVGVPPVRLPRRM